MARRAGYELDPWQEEVLCSDSRQVILLASRQSGKSTTVALKAAHRAVYRPGSLILVLSPSLRQSVETFRKIVEVCLTLEREAAPESETLQRLELANGSRVVSLPGTEKSVRGYSKVDLLLVDEAARVDDALISSIRPMLAVSDGTIILLSTPFGRRGTFHEAWEQGGEAWHRVKVVAQECPRLTPEFLEEERRQLGSRWFSQEYECQFGDAADQVFRSSDIERSITDLGKLDWWGDD